MMCREQSHEKYEFTRIDTSNIEKKEAQQTDAGFEGNVVPIAICQFLKRVGAKEGKKRKRGEEGGKE